MTANDRFDRDLATWLDAETTLSAPAGLHAAAIDQARTARQQPAWLAALRGAGFGSARALPSFRDRPAASALLVLALLVAALVVAIAAGAFRSDLVRPLGRNGVLAYSFMTGSGTTTQETHLVAPNGSGDRPIGSGACPGYSSDGATLSYLTDTHDAGLMVAAGDGTRPRRVAGVSARDHALSPDGTSVATIQSIEPGNSELRITPVNGLGGRAIVVPTRDEALQRPTWSPDGTRVAFAVMEVGRDDVLYRRAIDVVDADGSNRVRVTSRIGPDTVSIAWSPNGRSIAFIGLPDEARAPQAPNTAPPWDVYVVGADGTGETRVAGATYPENVQWSPDGRHLALLTLEGGETWHLATFPMAGHEAAGPLVLGPEHGGPFVWSPDGRRIAYVHTTRRYDHDQPGVTSIRTVDPSFAGAPTIIVEVDRTITCLSWQWLAP